MSNLSKKKPAVLGSTRFQGGGLLSTDFGLSGWPIVLLRAALIAGVGVWIYWPALYGDWIWDDVMYFSQNPLLNDPARLWKAWFQPGSFIEYYPIEQTVQWAQWRLWGDDTIGYHLTNVCLHLLSAFLVWRVLSKFGLRLAWVGGLIFAIHPMMVESVAWISELKNTLSLPPFLLAMCAWIDYEERKQPRDYFLALALFLVAMLCKISAAPFPAVILLYAWWKRGRIGWRDGLACAPFFVIAVMLSLISTWSGAWYLQSQAEVVGVAGIGGFFSQLALAGQALSFYFAKCFWPVGPLPIYPQWKIDPASPVQYLPWLVLAGVVYLLWMRRQTWGRHVLLGLGFFILTLAPFLGFIPISYMNFTWVMDHFLYVPIIGWIGIVVAGIERVDARLATSVHPLSTGILTAIMALLAFESHWYAAAFTNDETFWTYTIDRNPESWFAQNNLGVALVADGLYPEAISHYQEVLRLKPSYCDGHYNLGVALQKVGRADEAQEQYRQALKLNPVDGKIYINLADCLVRAGKTTEAIEKDEQAVKLLPNFAPLRYNLGSLFLQTGNVQAAIEQLKVAVKLDPRLAPAHENLGGALAQSGNVAAAIEQFQAAIEIDPDYVIARDNLGLALAQTGRVAEAIEQFQKALQINPNDEKARASLEGLRTRETPPDTAIKH